MKRLAVRVSPEADEQIQEVAAWWRAHRKAAPGLFRTELAAAFDLLVRSPELGTPYHDAPVPEVRRLLLLRTRYHLYYTIDRANGEVFVRALWHTSRGEGPWLR